MPEGQGGAAGEGAGAAAGHVGGGAFAGEETRNVRNLILLVSGLVAWPALSAGLVMFLVDREDHLLHVALFLPLGALALLVFLNASRLARRLTAA